MSIQNGFVWPLALHARNMDPNFGQRKLITKPWKVSHFVPFRSLSRNLSPQEDAREVSLEEILTEVPPLEALIIKGRHKTPLKVNRQVEKTLTEASLPTGVPALTEVRTPPNHLQKDPLIRDITINEIGQRLWYFRHKWMEAPRDVQIAVSRGYHWGWLEKPPALTLPSSTQSQPHLSSLIQEWVNMKAIYPVPPQPCFLSRIFTVPKSNGSLRLVLDLSLLNSYIQGKTFKMTNHLVAAKIIVPPTFFHFNRYKERLYTYSNEKELTKIPGLLLPRTTIFRGSTPFRIMHSPLRFRQNNVISTKHSSRTSGKLRSLSRRSATVAPMSSYSPTTYPTGLRNFTRSRHSGKYREVQYDSKSHHRLARCHLERAIRYLEHTSRKADSHKRSRTSPQALSPSNQEAMGDTSGSSEFYMQNPQKSKHFVATPSASVPDQHSSKKGYPIQYIKDSTGLTHPLDKEGSLGSPTSVQSAATSGPPVDRCIERRVGGSIRQPQHISRDMVCQGQTLPHQPIRTENSDDSNSKFQPKQCKSFVRDRQRGSEILY